MAEEFWNDELESMASSGVIDYPPWRRKQLDEQRVPGLLDMAAKPVSVGYPMAKEMAKQVVSDPKAALVDPITDMATYPREVLMGRKKVRDDSGRTSDEAIQMGMDIAGSLGGQGLARQVASGGKRDPLQAGIFAGENAKNAPLKDLELAKLMEMNGEDRRKIWKDTGWIKKDDGKWRWEIDDSKVSLNRKAIKRDRGAELMRGKKHQRINKLRDKEIAKVGELEPPTDRWFKLGNIQRKLDLEDVKPIEEITDDFSAVSDAYPELRATTVDRRELGKGYFGDFDPDFMEMRVNSRIPLEEQNKTMIHELQHSVQGIEGHAPGTSVESIYGGSDLNSKNQYDKMLSETSLSLEDKWEKANPGKELTPREIKKIKGNAAFQLYEQTLGEAEARAASARHSFTPEERRNVFPEDSYDVPSTIAPLELPKPVKRYIGKLVKTRKKP